MKLRALLAVAAGTLCATACSPGSLSSVPVSPARHAAATTIAPVSSVAFGMFPNVAIGGAFGSAPQANLALPAATTDRTLTFTSSNPAVANPYATSVVVPAGSSAVSVAVPVSTVSTQTTVTISVSGPGVSQSAALTVYPQGSSLPPPILVGIAVNPLTVAAGASSNVTVTLSSPAPSNGLLLWTTTAQTAYAQVPQTVVVPAGATTATFPIATSFVFPNTTSTVAVQAQSANGNVETGINIVSGSAPTTTTTTATPTPTPTVSGPLATPTLISPAADAQFAPGSPVGFTWSSVSGATGYTIQVSTTDKFTSFVVNTDTTSPSLTASTLPTSTLFWRVRANGASASAWSATRRFEVK